MATIYFTSNADSGNGTLRAAIAAANAGDVITYDSAVFTTGPIIIAVSSALIAATNKNITIDGGELGVVIDGQQANIACISLNYDTTCTLINCTIKRFNRTQNAPIYLNSSDSVLNLRRCKIVDNQNNYFGAIYVLAGTVNLYDSLVCGNNSKQSYSTYAGGIRLGADGYLNLIRSTVVFNTIANVQGVASRQTQVNSFIGFNPYNGDDESLGDIEYVKPPEEEYIPFGDWTEGLWQNYDFRLKSTSPYLTGAAYESGDVDLLGHARTGSWGCFDGSWLVVGASGAETVASDTTVDWLEIASTGVLTLSGSDRILTVNRGIYAVGGAVASSSRGYLVIPSGATADGLTLTNVVACYAGAGASNLAATTSAITWSATDSAISVVLEQLVSGAWQTIAITSGVSYSTTLAVGASVRLFDGVNFLTATVPDPGPTPTELTFHPWGVYEQTITVEAATASAMTAIVDNAATYTIKTGFILMSNYYNEGETPVLFARITNSQTGAAITPSDVSSIEYTAYKVTSGWATQTKTAVTGHSAVPIDSQALLASVVPPSTDPRWTADTVGYNFIFEPDSRTNPIFPTAGDYEIIVTIKFASANPLPIVYQISVN